MKIFPQFKLTMSGKWILADLDIVLMKKTLVQPSQHVIPLVCRHLLNYSFLVFFQLRSIIFPILFYPGFLKRQCLCKSAGRHPAPEPGKQFKSHLKEKQNSQTCHWFCEKWCLAGGEGPRQGEPGCYACPAQWSAKLNLRPAGAHAGSLFHEDV